MEPGSQNFLAHKKALRDLVLEDVKEACNGRLDLVILTHEHQDHLNGIWSEKNPPFENFEIEEAWMAWTEDPDNDLANRLRKRHRDQLLGLVEARNQLAAAAGADSVRRIDQMLTLELGGDSATFSIAALAAAAKDPEKSVNKQGLKLVKDKAMKNRGCFYLSPGGDPVALDGTKGVRAFVLGPPENDTLIADEDPH